MWTYFLGPFLSLLPRRWRSALLMEIGQNWARATFVSGVAIGAICLLGLLGWYLHFVQVATSQQADLMLHALSRRAPPEGMTGAGTSFAMGLVVLTAFLLEPLTWVLAYFAVEGFARAIAAAVTGESPASLPLVIVAWAVDTIRRRRYEQRVPLVADQVTHSDGKQPWDLHVASCRPKPEWKYPLTVRYQGEFFQVMRESPAGGTPARPHVYVLRHPPAGEAFRGLREYDPDEVLRIPEKPPNFLVAIIQKKAEEYRISRLPQVPDAVERGDGTQGWHLRLESCRAIPDWTPGRTIRFEDALYRLDAAYRGSVERPFGYRLRRLPEGEAARGIVDYVP